MIHLFRWVTHSRAVDSAVLEQEVSVIFNFMLGIGGRRITALFNFITGRLGAWSALNITEVSRMEMLELSLSFFSKALNYKTSNYVNTAFNPLADKLTALLGNENDEESYSSLQARKYIDYIKLRLGVRAEIPVQQERRHKPVTREQFIPRRNFPRELSADSPRHDNDHTNIEEIKIIPTTQEIVSPRAEYLPTTDSKE